MTKYDEKFKLAVVQQYLGGTAGFKVIAREHGLAHAMVRRWVSSFRTLGINGLRKKFSRYSAEFKLSVLQHMWDNDLSYGQAAVQFDIRNPNGLEALQPGRRGRSRQMPAPPIKTEAPPEDAHRSREELLAEVKQLRMEVAYLKKLRALVQAQQKALPAKKRK